MVFSSSIAVFGGSPAHPLPTVVTDQTLPDPQSSYGTQKVMSEYLLADYTRKGFLRGRTVRLATVAVRPGRPNAAASGFLSGILREPLAGQRAVCPVAPETAAVIASPDKAVVALLCAARSAADAWGGSPVSMAALTVTVAEMVAALERAAGPAAAGLIHWVPDPQVARLVTAGPPASRLTGRSRLACRRTRTSTRSSRSTWRSGGADLRPVTRRVLRLCWFPSLHDGNQHSHSYGYAASGWIVRW